jgi:RimJ/RimL family protein N-acetyltransferase
MPEKFSLVILNGRNIQLERITTQHYDELLLAANYEEIWEFMPLKATKENFHIWFSDVLTKDSNDEQFTYVVKRKCDQKILGSTAFYEIQPSHKRLTLGYSWLSPDVWNTRVNTESKLLMLTYAFEVLGINRVEIGTDSRNMRSYQAIKKLGAREEGILREHMILHDGVVTDTIMFSILASEWNNIRISLQNALGI